MNYDPNLTMCGRTAIQTVRLVFQQWDFKKEIIAEVGGNRTGLAVIETAVNHTYDSLPGGAVPEIVLSNKKGETLGCEDEDEQGYEWLSDMLVSAEITDIKVDMSDNAVKKDKRVVKIPGGRIFDGEDYWAKCPECGCEQADMGHHVSCEQCGYGPMPTMD